MKTIIAKILLNVATWLFDKVYDLVDRDNDGNISKEELLETAKYLDKWSKELFKKLK